MRTLSAAIDIYVDAVMNLDTTAMARLLHPNFHTTGHQSQGDIFSNRAQWLDFIENYKTWPVRSHPKRPEIIQLLVNHGVATVAISEWSFGEHIHSHLTFVVYAKDWFLASRTFSCLRYRDG